MSRPKKTFIDPKTGEKIESTALSRWVVILGAGLGFGVLGLLFDTLFYLGGWFVIAWLVGGILGGIALKNRPGIGLVVGLAGGLGVALVLGLLSALSVMTDVVWGGGVPWAWSTDRQVVEKVIALYVLVGGLMGGLVGLLGRTIHNTIARQQHFHRQRLLKRKLLEEEWAGVPDGALSRAQPPGEPEPTAASLSRSEAPEEAAPRLTVSVDVANEEEELVATRQQR